MIANRKAELMNEKSDMKDNKADLKAQLDYKAAIKPDCDWVLNSFEERAEKRKAEMDGLVTAKEYLAGAAPAMVQLPAMMQMSAGFDDTKLERIGFESLRR